MSQKWCLGVAWLYKLWVSKCKGSLAATWFILATLQDSNRMETWFLNSYWLLTHPDNTGRFDGAVSPGPGARKWNHRQLLKLTGSFLSVKKFNIYLLLYVMVCVWERWCMHVCDGVWCCMCCCMCVRTHVKFRDKLWGVFFYYKFHLWSTGWHSKLLTHWTVSCFFLANGRVW